MGFYEILDQILGLLRHHGRVTYRALKREFQLDDDFIEDLKEELIYSQKLAVDEADCVLVWTADAVTAPAVASTPAGPPMRAPLIYTPPISPRRFSRLAVPSKASANKSPCCLRT